MFDEQDRKYFYDEFKNNGYQVGSYDEFKKDLNNKEDRDWYYNEAKNMGYDVGTQADFDKMVLETAPSSASPATAKEQTPAVAKSEVKSAPVAQQAQEQQYPQEVMDAYNSPDNKADNFKDLSQLNDEYQRGELKNTSLISQAVGMLPKVDAANIGKEQKVGSMLANISFGGNNQPQQPTEQAQQPTANEVDAVTGETPTQQVDAIYNKYVGNGDALSETMYDLMANGQAQNQEEAQQMAMGAMNRAANTLAQRTTDDFVSKLGDSVEGIEEAIPNGWYSHGVQEKLKNMAAQLGIQNSVALDENGNYITQTDGYDQFINGMVKPAMVESLVKKYGENYRPIANDLAARLYSHDEHVQGELMNRDMNAALSAVIGKYTYSSVEKAVQDAEEAANAQMGKYNEQSKYVDAASPFAVGAIAEANKTRDPQKVLGDLQKKFAKLYQNEDFLNDMSQAAYKVMADYGVQGRLSGDPKQFKPMINAALKTQLDKLEVGGKIPRGSAEYILKTGLGNTIVGKVSRKMMQTDYQNWLEDIANQQYQPGFWDNVASGALTFAGDAWSYWLPGAAGTKLTKSMIAKAEGRLATDLWAKGMERKMAERAAKVLIGKSKGMALKSGAAHGAVTFGGQSAISKPIDEKYRTGQFDENGKVYDPSLLKILGSTVGEVAKQSAVGAIMQGGTIANMVGKGRGLATNILADVGGKVADSSIMTGQQMLERMAQDPNFKPTGKDAAESFLESMANLTAIGLPGMMGKYARFKDAREFNRKYDFTEQDVTDLKRMGYDGLRDAFEKMGVYNRVDNVSDVPVGGYSTPQSHGWDADVAGNMGTKKLGEPKNVNKPMIEAPEVENLTTEYMNLMSDKSVPEVLKAKMMAVVEGKRPSSFSPVIDSVIVQPDNGGKVYLETLNKDGGVIDRKEYSSLDEAQKAEKKLEYEKTLGVASLLEGEFHKEYLNDHLFDLYNQAAQKYYMGEKLSDEEKAAVYLRQNAGKIGDIMMKRQSGIILAPEEQKQVDAYQHFYSSAMENSSVMRDFVSTFEDSHGVARGTLRRALESKDKKYAPLVESYLKELYNSIELKREMRQTAEDLHKTSEDEKDYGLEEKEGKTPAEATTEPVSEETVSVSPPYKDRTNSVPSPIDADFAEKPANPANSPESVEEGRTSGTEPNVETSTPNVASSEGNVVTSEAFLMGQTAYKNGDTDGLKAINRNDDVSKARLKRAFVGKEELMNTVLKAYEEGKDMEQFVAQRAGYMTPTQQEAVRKYVEAQEAKRGVLDALQHADDSYAETLTAQLWDYQTEDGNVVPVVLSNGMNAFLKKANEYGGCFVVKPDENGNPKILQSASNDIKEMGTPIPFDEFVSQQTEEQKNARKKQFFAQFDGSGLKPNDKVEVAMEAGDEPMEMTFAGYGEDGKVILSDGKDYIPITKDEFNTWRQNALETSIGAELDAEDTKRAEEEAAKAEAEKQERYKKAIFGYAAGQPDYSDPQTDPKVAAEYLQETSVDNRKSLFGNIEAEKKGLQTRINQLREHIANNEEWLSVNADLDPKNAEARTLANKQLEGQISDLQTRFDNWNKIRSYVMTPEEAAAIKADRTKKIADAGVNEGEITPVEGREVPVLTDEELKKQYPTMDEASDYIGSERKRIYKLQSEEVQREIDGVDKVLDQYKEGEIDLEPEQIRELNTAKAQLQARQQNLTDSAKELKAQEANLGKIYWLEQRFTEMGALGMTPSEQRKVLVAEAIKKKDLGTIKEIYKDSSVDITDLTPQTLEEAVSEALRPHSLNAESLQSELGAENFKYGIGKGYDSNKYNYLLAKKGTGLSVIEFATRVWNDLPINLRDLGYTDQDVRNTLLDMFKSYDNVKEMRNVALMNRIAAAEEELSAEEDWYEAQKERTRRQWNKEAKDDKKAKEFHSVIDQMFDDANFDKSQHQRERYDLGKTPDWMKNIGIKGDDFSLSFKSIKVHKGKDADHDLTKEEWHSLPEALQHPFAITRYQGAEDRFRLYVNINHNGKPVAVGVDVKRVNQGKDKPQLDVNSIKTVFAHHGEIGGSEVLVTYDKEITPQQQALLRGLNFHEYPTIQELSAGKGTNNSDNLQEKGEENAEKMRALEQEEEQRAAYEEEQASPKDNQGNPINADGSLKLEPIKSVDELTDDDFLRPSRNVELPAIPKNVDEAIGANGKPVIIKKNIFEKNQSHHDFPTSESREILKSALYNPNLTGQTQPSKKPNHWVAIKLDEKSPITVLEVNEDKDNIEVVGWYTLDQRNLDRIKRQAERNGGELIVLSARDKVGSLSTPTLGLSSAGKGTNNSDNLQGKGEENAENLPFGAQMSKEDLPFSRDVKEVKPSEMTETQKVAYDAVSTMLKKAGIPVKVISNEEMERVAEEQDNLVLSRLMNDPRLRFYIKTPEQKKAANAAYDWASKHRPDKHKQYAIVNMDNPNEMPEYFEKKDLAERARKYYSNEWRVGNYKAFDLDKPFEEQVKSVKGDVPDEFDPYNKGTHKADKIAELQKQKEDLVKQRDELLKKLNDYNIERNMSFFNAIMDYRSKHPGEKIPDSVIEEFRDKSVRRYDPRPELSRQIEEVDAKINAIGKQMVADGGNISYLKGKGTVYGYTDGKEIVLNQEHLNPNTPIHEYQHIWRTAAKGKNPDLIAHGDKLIMQTSLFADLKKDSNYKHLSDEQLCDEAFSRLTGEDGAKILEDMAKEAVKENPLDTAKELSVINKLKDWLKKFWYWTLDTFTKWKPEYIKKMTLEDIRNLVLRDLAKGVDPRKILNERNADLKHVNDKFNADLKAYVENGVLPENSRFELGLPSDVLLSAGFPKLPISMRVALLNKKAGMERHPFAPSDLYNMVDAMQKPLAVFEYSKPNMRNLIVDLTKGEKHFLVGVTLDYRKGELAVNSVSGLFPKENHEWIKWIQDGKAIRIDQKEKVLSLINSLRTNPEEADRIGLNLDSAAKIVKDFENPNENGENFSLKDDKTLVGVHNITEEKLRKALKLGGFANPSVAVIDTGKSAHNSFGEISFIAPSALVDKRTGGTAGTWTTDAYTQRYPSVERKMSDKGYEKFKEWVKGLDYPADAKTEIERQAKAALEDNREPAWELMYLKEKGIDIKGYDSKVHYLWQEIIENHPSAEDILESMKSDPKLNEDVTRLATSEIISPTWRRISQEVSAQMSEELGRRVSSISPKVRAKTKEIFDRDYAPSLLNKDGSPKKADVKKVVKQMVQQYEDTKTISFQKSKVRASSYVHNNGLYSDYIRWQENKLDEFGTKNRLFRGYKNDGTRKYVPETLENVSKAMRDDAEGQTNGSEYTTFGSFIAKLADHVDSTDEMRANKEKLSSNEDKQDFYEKWEEVYYDLAKSLYNDLTYGEQRLHDIVTKSDPKKYAKKEYGITLTPTFMKNLDALKKAVREELKSNYFETKFERPVHLDEFVAAVVPKDLGADVRKGLEKSGLRLYDYDASKEGDRQRAFDEAINGGDNIRFMFAGERGAAEADKAEEQTIRMDNLKVSEEMERGDKDAKAIKLATGWERGADGKWRYEIPDIEYVPTGYADLNRRVEMQPWGKEYIKLTDRMFDGETLNDTEMKRLEELFEKAKEVTDIYKGLDKKSLADYVRADDLFKAYPELRAVNVVFVNKDASVGGSYSDVANTIYVNENSSLPFEEVFAHEIQHAIQYIEGFAKGGSPEMFHDPSEQDRLFAKFDNLVREKFGNNDTDTLYGILDGTTEEYRDFVQSLGGEYNQTLKALRATKKYTSEKDFRQLYDRDVKEANKPSAYTQYLSLAGEVEARNVQKRMGMTDEERRNSLASETEDVNRDEQIVMNGDGASYSIVEDPKTIEKLDKEETVTVYRAMQLGEDGKLYPPMAAKVKGKFVQPIELGKWEQADERPDLADDKGMFTLNKGNGKSLKAAYNPYLHTSRTPLNDQFSEAQSRPNIVTVEVEVPKSELTSGYKAEKAKDAVGEVEWKAGIIQGQLTGKRKVILSRWDKPIRIVPDSEVADVIVNDMFKNKKVVMPTNVVTPSLRKELEKRGVPFVETDNRGRIVGGENDGVHYSQVYGKKAKKNGILKFSLGDNGTDVANWKGDSMNQNPNKDVITRRIGSRVQAQSRVNETLGAAAADLQRSLGATAEEQRPTWNRRTALGYVRRRAEELSSLLSEKDIKEIKGGFVGHGQENYVYQAKYDPTKVIKFNDFGLTDDLFRINEFIDRVNAHNQFQPNDRYTPIGFAYDEKGDFCIVMEQPYIKGTYPTREEITQYLTDHGFELDMIQISADDSDLGWTNGKFDLWDAEPRNVIKDENGDLHFFDTMIQHTNIPNHKNPLRLSKPAIRTFEAQEMKVSADKVQDVANDLGGAKATTYAAASEVPEQYKEAVEQGARGWYDPSTHTVHVYLPNCADANEAQRTVFHEKIGHEGMEVLLGGESGVRKFANFVYKSVGKKLRGKILDFANKYDPDWKNPDRMNVGTQEYIAHLAEEGPMTAEDFSIWTKIKHYLIKALKKLGIRVPGLLNDKDLRYYLMKAGKALHVWDNMPKAKQEAMMAQASNADIKDALSDGAGKGKPRQKKGESAIQYMKRVMEWKRWKEAREDENDPEPPQFYDFDKDIEGKKEWEQLNKDWRSRHDISEELYAAINNRDTNLVDAVPYIVEVPKRLVEVADEINGTDYFRKHNLAVSSKDLEAVLPLIDELRKGEDVKIGDDGRVVDKDSIANQIVMRINSMHLLDADYVPLKSSDILQEQVQSLIEKDVFPTGKNKDAINKSRLPMREEGETDDDYAKRIKEYEKWNAAVNDKEDPMPDMFSFEKDRQKEASKKYEDWLARHELLEQEQADLDLYEGKIYPAETNPEADALEQRMMQDLAEVTSTDVSKEGAARTVKHAVIHRRKNMEEASADDAIYINDVKNRIEKMADSGVFDKLLSDYQGKPNKAEKLAEAIPYIIEAPRRLRDIAHDLNNTGVFDKGHIHIQPDDVEAIQPYVDDLARETSKKHIVVNKKGEEEEVYDDLQAVSELAGKMAQTINGNHQGEEDFVPIDGTDILSEHVLPLVRQKVVPEGIDYKNITPEMQATLDSIRYWYNHTYDWLKDNHTLREDTGFNTDYVNHLWDKEKSDKQAYATYVENRQRTKSPNEKPRTISTLMEGINVGLVPKTTDITKMMAYYSRSNIEAYVNKTMLQELSGLNVIERNEEGEIISSDPLLSSTAPFNLEQYRYFEIPGVGPVWVYNVSPKQVKVKNPISGKEKVLYSEASAGDRFGVVFDTYQSSPFWKGFDTLASSAKKLELGFSGFHAGALTEVYMVQNMVEFGPKKALANFMKYIFVDTVKNHELPCFANPEDFQEAATHLVKFGATNDYAAADVQNMFDNFRDSMMKIQEKLGSGNVVSKAGATVSLPFKVASQMLSLINKGMDRALWDFLHDGLKLASYRMRAEKTKARAKAKGWTDEQLSKALDEDGQFVNDMFGGQHWDVLGASHRTLRYAGRVLLSPDWNASTTRHFLALTGYGSIWNEATFENFKEYYKRLYHKELTPEDDGRRARQLSSLLCYGLGFMVFYEGIANGINAAFQAVDEEKERKKAEEMRKTNPNYKSPYELAYPNGMQWYDYLMRGNTLGQQSKIFMGRYADGTEMYIRHGKQFREVPEYLFNHKGELEFPGPMVQRMIGKANPMVRMTLDDINYLSDFQASHADQELQRKYGKTIGLLYKDALYWAPFLIPSQENKEFKAVDFFFPSSKGFSPWKAQSYFKDFILSGDMEGIVMTYNSCERNGIDPEAQIKAAIGSVKALETAEMKDGVTSLQIASQRFDEAKSVTEKKKMRQKMKKFLSQSEYKAFTQKEALDMVQSYLNGEDDLKEMEKADSKYLMKAKSEDVTEDWRIQAVWNGTMETYQEYQRLKETDKAKARAFKDSKTNKRLFEARKAISAAKKKMNKAKKEMDGRNDAAKLVEIRKTRADLLKALDRMQ